MNNNFKHEDLQALNEMFAEYYPHIYYEDFVSEAEILAFWNSYEEKTPYRRILDHMSDWLLSQALCDVQV